MQKKGIKARPFTHSTLIEYSSFSSQHLMSTMFQALFAVTSRFLYLGNILRGFAHGVLALRNLGTITSHLIPTLSSPPLINLLEAPLAPLEPLEVFRTPSPSGGLIVINGPPPSRVLPYPLPIRSYQSSLVVASPNSLLLDFLPLLLLALFLGFLPGLVYVCVSIPHTSRKFPVASILKSRIFSLFSLVSVFLPSQIFSRQSLFLLVSLPLFWTAPVRGLLSLPSVYADQIPQSAITSFFALICIISKPPIYKQFSNTVSVATHTWNE